LGQFVPDMDRCIGKALRGARDHEEDSPH
jgi:hypothetical protein